MYDASPNMVQLMAVLTILEESFCSPHQRILTQCRPVQIDQEHGQNEIRMHIFLPLSYIYC